MREQTAFHEELSSMAVSANEAGLAIHGGPKVRTDPWPVRRLFNEAERDAAVALFDEAIAKGHHILGYNGPQEDAYCREFAASLGGGFADGVNSGTSAVYVAMRALELEPFSEVIVPPITDPGGVMPVALMQCIPVPADAAPGSYNTSADQIEARITPRTRAIVVAHIAGIPADLGGILELADRHGLPVLEDCAQAHGALYRGRPVGSFGTISVFSTMFGKHHATAGQGGLVFTRDESLYWRVRRYADRGKPFGLAGVATNVAASLNFNMDELHACIGRVQLKKLPSIVQRRRHLAAAIARGCEQSLRHIRLVIDPAGCEGSYWFLFFSVCPERLRVSKQQFVEALVAEGIPVDAGYRHVACEAAWWKDRAVFGHSGLPWTSPLVEGQAAAGLAFPNLDATEACHFRMLFHEDWSDGEVADLVRGLAKVERAFTAG
jgi:dTDP-4-amino-4,6-dideoxygalactose transaminase